MMTQCFWKRGLNFAAAGVQLVSFTCSFLFVICLGLEAEETDKSYGTGSEKKGNTGSGKAGGEWVRLISARFAVLRP